MDKMMASIGIGIYIPILLLSLLIICGNLGLTIYNGIWWNNIRRDFPYKENRCGEAYDLYWLVFLGWVLPIVVFVTGIIQKICSCFPESSVAIVFSNIFSFITIMFSLAVFVVNCMQIDYSKESKCTIISRKIPTSYGRTTKEFIEWAHERGISTVQDFAELQRLQCPEGHKMISIFFGCAVGGCGLMIIVSLFFVCCVAAVSVTSESDSSD